MNANITINLSVELIEKIDALRGKLSRAAWLRKWAEHGVKAEQPKPFVPSGKPTADLAADNTDTNGLAVVEEALAQLSEMVGVEGKP